MKTQNNALEIPPKTSVEASTIVLEARTWLGTRFRHQGRLKAFKVGDKLNRAGVDCIGLIVGVIRDLKIDIPVFTDNLGYNRLGNGKVLIEALDKFLIPYPLKSDSDFLQGLVLLFSREDSIPCHVGFSAIETGPLKRKTVIHSYFEVNKVTETPLDKSNEFQIYKAYKVPNVNYDIY